MTFRKAFAVLCVFAMTGSSVEAAAPADFQAAVNQITADSILISQWTSDQLKYIVPFNSTAGNVMPGQLKVLGFELGVEGVVSSTKLDTTGLRNLGTSVVNTSTIDTFSRFPMPAIIGHAKIGLPFGLDAGVRVGGIPKKSFDKDDTHLSVKNSIFGIDLRKKVIEEGIAKPFGLTVGANFTRASGSLDTSTPYSSNAQTTINGTTYNSTLNATGTSHSEWDTTSWGIQAVANKQILFLNPYIGASANRNFGSVTTSIGTNGTETITNASNAADTFSQSFSTLGSASARANKWDVRALFGIEFSFLPFLKMGLHGEYAGSKNLAGALGLRLQFR